MESWDLDLVASNNNILLPPETMYEMKSCLCKGVDNVLLLEEEIARTESILEDLRARRLQEISRIQAYRVAIAPHRKLPNEILALIFSYAASIPFLALWSNSQPQSIISQVCKKWREVSHGIPMLWNNISWGGGYSLMNNSKILKSVETVLSRTANSPITLNIRSRPGPLQSAISSRLLKVHAGKLKSLTIDRCTASGLRSFLILPCGSVDTLEHIDLEFEQSQDWEDIRISVFEDAPNLRNVKLSLPRDFNPCSLNLPWARLTHLSIPTAVGNANNPRVDTILRQSPSLVDLTIDIRESEMFDPALHHSEIFLNLLQSFNLNLHSHQSDLLKYLLMPKLAKIILKNCTKIPWQPEYIKHFAFSGVLQIISIDLPVPTSAIDAILTHNPRLVELRLPSSEPFSMTSLNKMAFGELVPKLEIMELYLQKGGPIGLSAYLHMVRSRRFMGAAICSEIPILEFKLRLRPDKFDDSMVQTFRENGWSIRFR